MPNINYDLLDEGRVNMKKFNVLIFAWCLVGLLLLSMVAIILLANHKMNSIVQGSRDLMDLSISREQFYIEWHERVSRQNTNEHTKALYFNYASELIRQHYQRNPSLSKRQMRPDEIYDLLDAIWYYTASDVFPTLSYPDGLFLPLAFAVVETDFYPDVIGEDGERSIFQFMDATARDNYSRNGRTFVDNFWLIPQESVWLFFNYYRHLSSNFIHEDKEREIRWTALAYNAGLYRNRLIPRFEQGFSIDAYLREFPLNRGFTGYNRRIYEMFRQYRDGFGLLGLNGD